MSGLRIHFFLPIFVSMIVAVLLISMRSPLSSPAITADDDYQLVWSDEFNRDGRPDTSKWHYEQGFVRNHELHGIVTGKQIGRAHV